jgi:site-specific recombinase XerD
VGTIKENGLLEQFEIHLSNAALAPATVINYVADLRAFLRWSEETGDTPASLLGLTTKDIQAYCYYLQDTKGHAPTTVNRRIQALRKFYDLFVRQGRANKNPAEDVPLLAEGVSERSRSLTDADVGQLMAAVREGNSRWPDRDWAIFQVLVGAGLKLGELTQMRLDDLDLEAEPPCLAVRGTSDGPGRSIPLDAELCAALRRYLARRQTAPGEECFFVNRDGKPLSTRSVQRLLDHYAQKAGLEGLTTQALRFVYARQVYDRCQDLEEVARLLGHRHLATTTRYLRSTADEKS